ncbi:ABC transporter permease [Streptomyces thermolineatus]|uniref:ABC transporter permease n=1 Tax=Streptomyces thermolineatus TaxID=44033 RepID=UPI00384DDAE7
MPQPETTAPAAPAAAPPPGSAPDVIHNIGYRHYDGPRLGRAYVRRSLFAQSLRGAYGLGRSARSKVLPMILVGVMCAPALVVVAVAVATKMNKLPLEYTGYAIYLQAVIGLYVASQAPQAVSTDLRFRTVTLYFSRPIERFDYVAAKYAALSAAVFLLNAVPLLILYVGALLAKMPVGAQTLGLAKGLVGTALMSLLLSGLGLVVAAATPRRGFGVAGIIALFTFSYAAVGTVQSIALMQDRTPITPWLGLLSPTTLLDGVQVWLLDVASAHAQEFAPTGAAVGAVGVLLLLGTVAGCFGLLMRRYRKVGLS